MAKRKTMTKSENQCEFCRHLNTHHDSSGKCQWKYLLGHKICSCLNISLSNMNKIKEVSKEGVI